MKRHKWGTHKVIQETKDAVTIIFDTGQPAIGYQAGQFLTISCSINGELVRRSYSFSSVPSDEFPAITVKRVKGGKMSNYLVDNAGHINEWEIEAPFGNFILNRSFSESEEMVFLAGGSGISPLFSMLKNLDDNVPTPLLMYANKTPEDTIFSRELEAMRTNKRLNVFYSYSADATDTKEWNCISVRFSLPIIQTVIRQYIQAKDMAHYFICGPTDLMQIYRDALLAMGIAEEQIHTEYFNPAVPDNTVLETDDKHKEVLVSYYDSYYINDEPQTYECTCLIEVKAGQTILDAVVKNDIKVSKSCEKGTCGLCWATKKDGNVQMLNNYALTEEEVAEGRILLCQSYPLDQSVSVVIV